MALALISKTKCFSGQQMRYRHTSQALNCEMVFSIFLPEKAENENVPALYWLSGLTCSDENFVTKAGAQRYANEFGIALIMPDTSPRGELVADDPDKAYDLGLGAGFYLNATQEPWLKHYQMYQYIVEELPDLISENFAIDASKISISGHSMGGHGALTIAFKNLHKYKSVSAFSPICSPKSCAWGEKAFTHYLGNNKASWQQYDACSLLKQNIAVEHFIPLLVDQGTDDDFLADQLKPELLQQACSTIDYPLRLRMQHGYDHSYYFISSFIGDHIAFHAKHLYA